MDSDSLLFYLEVIKEVIEAGTVPSIDNIEKHIGHRAKRHELVEAVGLLLEDGRIQKRITLVGWDADWQPREVEYYYPSPRKGA
jgi:hypothetical protein